MPNSADAKGNKTTIPVNKVISSGAVGALVTILVWLANHFWLSQKDQIDGPVSAAATTFLTFVVGYVTPPGKNESVT